MQRSHYCNLFSLENAYNIVNDANNKDNLSPDSECGKIFVLNGWVRKIRRHGAICFINLRDRYGELQLTIDNERHPDLERITASLRLEYCIAAKGVLQFRPKAMQNPSMQTGAVEMLVEQLEVLNTCEPLPFMLQREQQEDLHDESDGSEALRLKYRYLDLRSAGMQRRMILRHRITHQIHEFLHRHQFLQIETPTLIRSMPEGARDYLVPSRVHGGQFYALAQSPQLYKQLLMVGALDRYYQIARCYRDEDARGDRQPEFTQLDLEMSFVRGHDVQKLVEGLVQRIWREVFAVEMDLPFVRLRYEEAMNRYGSDKPDLRNPLQIQEFSDVGCEFGVFREALANNGAVRVLVAPQAQEHCSRKVITDLEEEAKKYGAKGLAWTRIVNNAGKVAFTGGIARFLQPEALIENYLLQAGDMLFFAAGPWETACTALGAVRKKLGEKLKLIDSSAFAFAWVVDFPLFAKVEPGEAADGSGNWVAAHHMFSMPYPEYLKTLEQDPGAVRGDIYDLVLNGYEIGSGSVRIHSADIQERVFRIAGYSAELAKERFGFMLDAFRYGAPPHGGIALGLDRLVMIMAGRESIKDVIAFPKNNLGQSLMDGSPGVVGTVQLAELGIQGADEHILKQQTPDNDS